ncbi:MAG TPA: winged helix-turn-helix domain-containing protein [Roseomonas sp.]|jgi:transposase
MVHGDMRSLTPGAQQERRRQVIGLRESGLTYEAIAGQVGLTRNGVFDICKHYAARGEAGLRSGPRGPAPSTGWFLTAVREAEVRRLIRRHTPDELGLAYALWSQAGGAGAGRAALWRAPGGRTMGIYLARWSFTPQNPLRRAHEQRSAEVQHWLRQEYPAIVARARRERGVISWVDETGLCSNDVRAGAMRRAGKRRWSGPTTGVPTSA